MLVTPPKNSASIGAVESALISVVSNGFREKEIGKGLILMGHWNPKFVFKQDSFHHEWDHRLELNPRTIIGNKRMVKRAKERGITDDNKYLLQFETNTDPLKVYRNYKRPLRKRQREYAEGTETLFLNNYGVCDSPEQLLSIYDFEKDERKLFICFVEIKREDEPSNGGWRYHKWGEYVGEQNPQSEYIYHDKHIEKVYTYSVYQLKD